MKTVGLLIGTFGLAVTVSMAAQSRRLAPPPDLSGTWVMVDPTPMDPAVSLLGLEFDIAQTTSAVSIKSAGNRRESRTYGLDDTVQEFESTSARGTVSRIYTRTRFVGAALVITKRVDAGTEGHWEDMVVLSRGEPGHLTVVSFNAAKSMQSGMNTRVERYVRK